MGKTLQSLNYFEPTLNLRLLLIISTIIFLADSQQLLSQTDYKISTEGYVFKNPTKDNVTLAVYFSVNNIGAVSDFYGPLRNVRLSYMQSGSRQTVRHIDSRIIMRDDNDVSNYAVVELLYNIPRTVTQLKISTPDHPLPDVPIVESIIYDKSFNDYEKTGGKDIVYEGGQKPREEVGLIRSATRYVGFAISLGLGVDMLEASYRYEPNILIDLSICPTILRLNKDENYSLGINTFLTISGHHLRGSNIFDFSDYQIVYLDRKDSIAKKLIFGGGPAFKTRFGGFSTISAINFGITTIGFHNHKFINTKTNTTYENPSTAFFTVRTDLAFSFASSLVLGYTFLYGKSNGNVPFFNGIYRQHYLRIGFGAF